MARIIEYRKATRAENLKLGASASAERYVPAHLTRITKRTASISKRAYQQKKLGVTLETRAAQYKAGERQYATATMEKAAKGASLYSRLRKQFPSVKPTDLKVLIEFNRRPKLDAVSLEKLTEARARYDVETVHRWRQLMSPPVTARRKAA